MSGAGVLLCGLVFLYLLSLTETNYTIFEGKMCHAPYAPGTTFPPPMAPGNLGDLFFSALTEGTRSSLLGHETCQLVHGDWFRR